VQVIKVIEGVKGLSGSYRRAMPFFSGHGQQSGRGAGFCPAFSGRGVQSDRRRKADKVFKTDHSSGLLMDVIGGRSEGAITAINWCDNC
jgi:hypothetical protein